MSIQSNKTGNDQQNIQPNTPKDNGIKTLISDYLHDKPDSHSEEVPHANHSHDDSVIRSEKLKFSETDYEKMKKLAESIASEFVNTGQPELVFHHLQLVKNSITLDKYCDTASASLSLLAKTIDNCYQALAMADMQLRGILDDDIGVSVTKKDGKTEAHYFNITSENKSDHIKYPGLTVLVKNSKNGVETIPAMITKDSQVSYISYQTVEKLGYDDKIVKTNIELIDVAGNKVINEGRVHFRGKVNSQAGSTVSTLDIPLKLFVVRDARVPIVLSRSFYELYKVKIDVDSVTLVDDFKFPYVQFYQEKGVPMLPELFVMRKKKGLEMKRKDREKKGKEKKVNGRREMKEKEVI